jgi:monoterpene epsilon-lactone hydrolase
MAEHLQVTNTVADRRPSRQSGHVRAVMRLTAYPLSMVAPRNRLSAYTFRALLHVGMTARGAAGIDHVPVRDTHRRRPVVGEWIAERPAPGTPILFYLHGSAYVGCSTATHRRLVARLVRRTGRPAFSLEYPLAPRHRFPAAHDAVVAGYRWLLEQGFRAEDIVVAGDSAGGHLALALCGELRRLGLPMPAGLALMSPLVDATFDTAAAAARRTQDPTCVPRGAKRLLHHYTRGADRSDPRLDVIQEVGADLPPMLIQAGGSEMMSADAELFAAAQTELGGRCELQVWPGQIHVFQAFGFLPESGAALDEIAAFIARLDLAADAEAG